MNKRFSRRGLIGLTVGTVASASWAEEQLRKDYMWREELIKLKEPGDQTARLQNLIYDAISAGRSELDLGSGTITASGPIFWDPRLALVCGNLVIDMSSLAPKTPAITSFVVDGGEAIKLGNLAFDGHLHDKTIIMSKPVIVEQGDVLVLYNPRDFSFSAHRSYYRSGEMVRASRTDGRHIALCSLLKDDYPQGSTEVWCLPKASFVLRGQLTVLGSPHAVEAMAIRRLSGVTICGKLICFAREPSKRALLIERCYSVRGEVVAGQSTTSLSGTDYGMSIANCQEVRLTGEFHGERHGSSVGGGDYSLSIPNRAISLKGIFSGRTPALPGTDVHGNSIDIDHEGEFHGGISVGGDRTRWRGKILLGGVGFAIYHSELRGCNHDYQGLSLCLTNATVPPNGDYGLIDLDGGSGKVMTADVRNGGTINFNDVTIDAPSEPMIARFKNRGFSHPAEGVRITMRNFRIVRMSPEGGDIRFEKLSGDPFAEVDISNSPDLKRLRYFQLPKKDIQRITNVIC